MVDYEEIEAFDEDDDIVVDALKLMKATQRKSTDIDFNQQILNHQLEAGKKMLFTNPEPIEEDLDELAAEFRVNALETFSGPAVTIGKYPEELLEKVATMSLQGMSVNSMVRELNKTMFGEAHEFTPYMIRGMLLDKDCKRVMKDIKDNVIDRAKDTLQMSAMKAVQKLLSGLDSENEKTSLACAKELIRLSGIGEAEEKKEVVGSAQTMQTEQLLLLAKALSGEAK